MKKTNGFTLAEILITLAIIGVVAAMTIPTLIAKINDIVTTNQAKVFNAKLIKGLNLTKTAGDLNDTYNSTYEFLTDGLGKNLKMAKVCINTCFAGVYDLNGTRKPNKYSVTFDTDGETIKAYTGDLRAFNSASIGSAKNCIGDVCLASTAVTANASMLSLIQAVDPSYTMPTYINGDTKNDYWTLAKDYCNKVHNGAHIPNASDLAKIARVLYNDNSISDANSNNSKDGLNWDAKKQQSFLL